MPVNAKEFFERWIAALNRFDLDAIEQMVEPDLVSEYTQSGERLNGFTAFREMLESYPGGLPGDGNDVNSAAIIGDEQRWAISPGYTIVPMSLPNTFVTTIRTSYPDGSHWWVVTLVEMRNDRVARLQSFFAPELPAPLAESIPAYEHG